DQDKAVERFDAVLADLRPGQVDPPGGVRLYRGAAHWYKGDLDGAIVDYEKALQLNPDLAAAYHERGRALMKRGDIEAALADFNEFARRRPDDPMAYLSLAVARTGMDDEEGALADLNRAVELAPDFAAAYVIRSGR